MLRNTGILPGIADGPALFDDTLPLTSPAGVQIRTRRSFGPRGGSDNVGPRHVAISPSDAVRRQSIAGRGITAELVEATGRHRVEFRYRGSSHLLVAYAQGVARRGETCVDAISRSSPHEFRRKLTFAPAGDDYFERHLLHTSGRLLFVYLDPAGLGVKSKPIVPSRSLSSRLLFEDSGLWSTAIKLMDLTESPRPEDLHYLEALGTVIMHELVRSSKVGNDEGLARGGLAAWQQRLVASYIEEHLPERIPLATLASVARLSPYHFSRAFKQSFGVPPHKFHTNRRIERAKALLERHALSVTEIGLTLGFSETSSFTATFRKTTGLTPSSYHRINAYQPDLLS